MLNFSGYEDRVATFAGVNIRFALSWRWTSVKVDWYYSGSRDQRGTLAGASYRPLLAASCRWASARAQIAAVHAPREALSPLASSFSTPTFTIFAPLRAPSVSTAASNPGAIDK